MKTARFVILLIVLSPAPGPAAAGELSTLLSHGPANKDDSLDSLRARILSHISQPRFNSASWGIKVTAVSSGKTVFEQNAAKYFMPASNAKLFTAALALDRLGPDYRIKTSLYSLSRPTSKGTLRGDLVVYGRGDPGISATFNAGDYYAGLDPLALALRAAGVRRVSGDLVGDQSYFKGAPFGAGWGWDDLQWYYGAEVSALSINDNSVDVSILPAEREGLACRITLNPAARVMTLVNRTQTGPRASQRALSIYRPLGENVVLVSGQMPLNDAGYLAHIAVHRPADLFVAMFKEVLQRHGITVTGQVRTVDWLYREVKPLDTKRLIELGSISSRPVAEIVKQTLKSSQNLYAQLLLLQVGAVHQAALDKAGSPGGSVSTELPIPESSGNATRKRAVPPSTEESGIEVMASFLTALGIEGPRVMLEEGAGLSRRDEVTPNSIIRLLTHMTFHPAAKVFADALPLAGVDGTLASRMKGSSAVGNVRAKTGALRFANALSGYVTTAAGDVLAFSILLNNYSPADGSSSIKDDLDAIVVMLSSFTGCALR